MPRSYGEFARPSYGDPRWMETQWFSAVTKDSGMRLHFWMGFRTNLGVATSKVYAFSHLGDGVLDMDLCDMQYHMPIGASRLSDYVLESGVRVRATRAPAHYELHYASQCGRMQAELVIDSLMDPVDLGYTKIDGVVTPGFVAFHKAASTSAPEGRTGTEPHGHIDQTMAVRGQVVLDGEVHEVDCVANRDHSWSPRAEHHHSAGTFDMFHYGRELTLLTHTGEDTERNPIVTHGYVLRGDQTRRIRSATVEYERDDSFPIVSVRYDVVDAAGERYELAGRATATAEIDGGQNMYLVMGLYESEWNGIPGYGEVQWHDYIPRMEGSRRRARATASPLIASVGGVRIDDCVRTGREP